MKRLLVLAVAVALLLFGTTAGAHRIDEYLQASLVSIEPGKIRVTMRLIPGVLVAPSVIAGIDVDGDGVFSDVEQRAYAGRVLDDLTVVTDGSKAQTKLESWSFPSPAQLREGLGEIHIEYSVALAPGSGDRSITLDNHHQRAQSVYLMNTLAPSDQAIQIVAQKRNPQQSTYEVDFRLAPVAAGSFDRAHTLLDGVQFAALFNLGMRHIAEGTDHLLFLLALLLPAGLSVTGSRWGAPVSARKSLLRILGIVSAFTVGHSITLALAALGVVSVPSRPIEILIAASIFVSAVHAMRPIFPGREALIAAGFGLIHGLAFAATLDRLGLGFWERVAGILAFNLGIESMQMLVVAAVLPSLLLLGGTRAYPVLRSGVAAFACTASIGWMVARLFNIDTRVDEIVGTFAEHAMPLGIAVFVASLAYRVMTETHQRERDLQSSEFKN